MKNQIIRLTFAVGIALITVSIPVSGFAQEKIPPEVQAPRQPVEEVIAQQAPKSEKENLADFYAAMREVINKRTPENLESRAHLVSRFEDFKTAIENDDYEKGENSFDALATAINHMVSGGKLKLAEGKTIDVKSLPVADLKALREAIESLDEIAAKKAEKNRHWRRIEMRSTQLVLKIRNEENKTIVATHIAEGKTLGQTLMAQLDEINGVQNALSGAEQALNACPSLPELRDKIKLIRFFVENRQQVIFLSNLLNQRSAGKETSEMIAKVDQYKSRLQALIDCSNYLQAANDQMSKNLDALSSAAIQDRVQKDAEVYRKARAAYDDSTAAPAK